MYQIVGGRSSGKTKLLLEKAGEIGGIFVCANPSRMREKASFCGVNNLIFISYEEYLRTKPENPTLWIDDLQELIRQITENTLKGYTLSIEE